MQASSIRTAANDHGNARARTQERRQCVRWPLAECVPRVTAKGIFQPMGGSTGARLVRASDGCLYVVKSARNPYGPRILANEYLATRLARSLGLPTPDFALVAMPARLDRLAELCFGSRLVCNQDGGAALTVLPACLWGLVENPADLWGAYVFDVWTGNSDCREVVFARLPGPRPLRLMLIDQGHCFAGRLWRFEDCSWNCASAMAFAYEGSGPSALDQWVSRVAEIEPDRIRVAAEGIPPEWLGDGSAGALDTLLQQLVARRGMVRSLVAGAMSRRDYPFNSCRFRMPPGAAGGMKAAARIA